MDKFDVTHRYEKYPIDILGMVLLVITRHVGIIDDCMRMYIWAYRWVLDNV